MCSALHLANGSEGGVTAVAATNDGGGGFSAQSSALPKAAIQGKAAVVAENEGPRSLVQRREEALYATNLLSKLRLKINLFHLFMFCLY